MLIQFMNNHGVSDRFETLGLVPEFFAMAVNRYPSGDIDAIAGAMNDIYQWGGFGDHWKGDIDADGVYKHPDDEPLHPYARLEYGGVTLWAYPYSIFALKDDNNQHIGRFD